MAKQPSATGMNVSHARGSVLVFAVVILSILTMLGVTFLLLVRQSGRASRNSVNSVEADAAAQSGLSHAEMVIKNSAAAHTIFTPSGTFWNPLAAAPLPPGTQVSSTNPYILEVIPNETGSPDLLPGAPWTSPLQQFISPAWNEEPAAEAQPFALLMSDPAWRAPHFTVAPLTLYGANQDRAWRYAVGTSKQELENFYKNPRVKTPAVPNPIRGQYYIWVADLDSKLNASAPNLGIDTSRMLNMPVTTEVARQIFYELRDLTPGGELGELTDADIDNVLAVMPAFSSLQDIALRLDSLADPNSYYPLRAELDYYLTVHLDNERLMKPLPGALNINTANLETIAAALSQIPADLPNTTLKDTNLHVSLATRIIEKRPFLSRIDFEDFLAAHLVEEPYRRQIRDSIAKRSVDFTNPVVADVSELTLSQFMEIEGLPEDHPLYQKLNRVSSMQARFAFFASGTTGILSVRAFNNILNSVSSPLLTDDDIQVHQLNQAGTVVIYPGLDSTLRVSPDINDWAVEIIVPGPDGVLNSIRTGDDRVVVGDADEAALGLTQFIIPKVGSTLQTVLVGDDLKIPVILSGTDGIANTRVASYFSNKQIQIAYDAMVPANTPCTIVVLAGANKNLELTKPVGDDQIVEIIIPQPGKSLQSAAAPGDVLVFGNPKEKAAGILEFIIPATGEKLKTTPVGSDMLTKAIIAGPDHIPQSGLFHFSYYSHDTAPQDYMPILNEPYKSNTALAKDPAYVGKFVYGLPASNYQPQNAANKNYTSIDLYRWSCMGNGERSGYFDMFFTDDEMAYEIGKPGAGPPITPPETVGIRPGPDKQLNTAPGSDDEQLVYSEGDAVGPEDVLVEPGNNGAIETIPGYKSASQNPDDKKVQAILVGSFSFTEPAIDDIWDSFGTYILPGPNGVLDTIPIFSDPEDPDPPSPGDYDSLVTVIIDGGNGICDTTKSTNDDYMRVDATLGEVIAIGENMANETFVWGPIRASQRRQDQALPANATQVPSARISDGKFGNGDVAWSPAFAYHSRFFGIYVLGQSLLRGWGYPIIAEPAPVPYPKDINDEDADDTKAYKAYLIAKAPYDAQQKRMNEISGEKRLEAVYDAVKDKIIWQRTPITEKHALGDPD